jgi:hypothetical protein
VCCPLLVMTVRCLQSVACNQNQSYITTNSQSASPSCCQAPICDPRPICQTFVLRQLRVCWCGVPSLTRGRVCNLQCKDASSISSYIATDGLSAISSWCRALNGAHDQILISLFHNDFPICSTLFLEGFKYGDLALQVGGVPRIKTIEYGLESRGTKTWAGLRWRGPAATVNYRPVLSSERVLQNNKPASV